MHKRIVSMAPSVTETICALGHQDLLVGVTEHCNFPDYCTTLPKIGGFANPDINKILELKPDCIITSTFHKPDKLAVFKEKGIYIEQVKAERITDSWHVIRKIGELINETKKATELANKIEQQINSILTKAKIIEHHPKVCYLCTSVPFCSYKSKCQTNHLVEQLGGKLISYTKQNIANDILQANPDLIIIPYKKDSQEYRTQISFIKNTAEVQNTVAYKNNKIVDINGELLSRPGPRSAEGLKLLFNIIHNKNLSHA